MTEVARKPLRLFTPRYHAPAALMILALAHRLEVIKHSMPRASPSFARSQP